MTLELRHIVRSYRQKGFGSKPRLVLHGIDLQIKPRSFIGVTGLSGAGKTTLGLILSGILRPDAGSMMVHGVDIWSAPQAARKNLNRKLQMVFQHPESTFNPRWTLARSLSEPYHLMGVRPSPSTLAAHLAAMDLDPSVLSRRPSSLSGGELQRLAIARAMVLKPDVLVLDEPTAMLDTVTRTRIMTFLERIRQRSPVACVLISHDIALVRAFCSEMHCLENGRLFSGSEKS